MSKESKQTEDFRKFVYRFCLKKFKELSKVKVGKDKGKPQAYIFNVPKEFSKYGYLKLVFSAKEKILLFRPIYLTKEFNNLFNSAKFNEPNHNDLPFLLDDFWEEHKK